MTPTNARARHGVFALLRRLRRPIPVLIGIYAVAVAGFTLIAGLDPQGEPWRMSFLHAFYFVSFLGTTIGLGEIPYPFSDAQRLWATGAIYGTLVAWLYAIGSLFNVLQDRMFRRILHEGSVERAVRRICDPFYLVCGYDDAGTRVTRELAQDGMHVVVIDSESTRVDSIEVEDLPISVPGLCADASDPRALLLAGLTHPHCAGVIALTGEDFVNTKIALTARLLNPEVPVLCAVRLHSSQARMPAAGAEHIINPHDQFAERVAISLRTPSLHVIYESLTTQGGTAMNEAPVLPGGLWLLCGTGLFTPTLRPQLDTFLRRARDEDEAWAAALPRQMREVIGDAVVESWSIELTPEHAPTVIKTLAQGESVTLRRLMTRADGSGALVHAVPLLLQRGQERVLRPELDTVLVVLLIPLIIAAAKRAGQAAGTMLLPMNDTVRVGGMATTIGTATNLIMVALAAGLGLAPFSIQGRHRPGHHGCCGAAGRGQDPAHLAGGAGRHAGAAAHALPVVAGRVAVAVGHDRVSGGGQLGAGPGAGDRGQHHVDGPTAGGGRSGPAPSLGLGAAHGLTCATSRPWATRLTCWS